MRKVVCYVDNITFEAKLRDNFTASKIIQNIPIQGRCNIWGKEFYFYTKLNIPIEKDASNIIEKGELAYWPNGDAIVIGFGKTPISKNEEIRLVDKCNIWADTTFDLGTLDKIINPKIIKIGLYEQR